MSVKVEVWGKYACFTRPEMKAERVSYDVITPSAARGILDAIMYHPGMFWVIDRIYVMNPIKFTSIMCNEVTRKISAQKVKDAMDGKAKEMPYLDAGRCIMQRSSTILYDVHYVIEAHFVMTKRASERDNPVKFQEMMTRRLKKGQCYHQPCFGMRDFPAHFRLCDGPIETIHETRDLGYMLYDMRYSRSGNITPEFFRANMVDGVIDLRKSKVVR